MNYGKEKWPMSIKELDELLKLRGWSKTELAFNLRLTEAAVWKWYRQGTVPDGPTSILLRNWLEDAREEAATKV